MKQNIETPPTQVSRQPWLPMSAAVARYGISYWVLHRLVRGGVFTRGIFSAAEKRPPIFLNVKELDAWKAGGIEAVRKVQARARKAKVTP